MRFGKFFIIVASLFLFLGACTSSHANADKKYDEYLTNGVNCFKEKNYEEAVSYFEKALTEKSDSEKASAYLTRAKVFVQINDLLKKKDYDGALEKIAELEKMEDTDDFIMRQIASLKTQISNAQQTATYENELDTIRTLIAEKDFDAAKSKLDTLKNVISDDSPLAKEITEIEATLNDEQEAYEAESETEEEKTPATGEFRANPDEGIFSYTTYKNERYGFTLQYPEQFAVGAAPTNGDGRDFSLGDCTIVAYGEHANIFYSNPTIEDFYNEALADATGPINYQRVSDNWYVISYDDGDVMYYEKGILDENIKITLNISYPVQSESMYDEMVTIVSNSFAPGSGLENP